MRKRIVIALTLAVLTLVSLSCQRKTSMKGVELGVKFSTEPLSDSLITDITYTWKTTKDFEPIERDLYVFVHFWHKDNMLLQDDHVPTIPLPQWEAGKEYTYTRRIFIPAFIDEFDPQFKGEETLRLVVGVYSPFDRGGKSKFEVLSEKLKVLPPPPDTPEIIYESGWFDQESDPASGMKQWRWTGKEGRCIIDNPRRDALLVVRGGQNSDAAPGQKVIIKINDQVLEEFLPENGLFDKSYTVKKEMLGDKDEFTLSIGADKTFVPSKVYPDSKDSRELGVQVSFLYFR